MDRRFREGLRIFVRYSIATITRLGFSPVTAYQKPKVLHIKPLTELATDESWSRTLLFTAL